MFTLDPKPLGLHIIAKANKPNNDKFIASVLAKKGITAHPYSNYFIGNNFSTGLVMGYASVNEKVMKKKIDLMSSELKAFK